MSLGKCAPCLDKAITSGTPLILDAIPEAAVLVTLVQQFNLGGGQQMAAPCLVPACVRCREQQLGTVSKTGLMTA